MFLDTLKHIFGRASIVAINQAAVLISLPILASRLDFFIFGQIAIGLLIVQLVWVLSDWGIQNYSIEIWNKIKNKSEKFIFASHVIVLNFLISILGLFIILLLMSFDFLNFPLVFWFAIIPSIIMGGIYPLWFYQVQKTPQDMIFPTFIGRLFFLIIIFFNVQNNDSAYWAFLAQGINLSIIVIYAFLRMRFQYSFVFKRIRLVEIINVGKSSAPYLINSLTNNQINTLWGFGLSIVAGPSAMALYNLGDQIYRAGGAITNIIAQSVRIYFIGRTFIEIRFTILFFVGLFSVITTLFFYLTDFLIVNYFPVDYLPASKIVKVMIFAWGFHAIVKLLNYPILAETFGAIWVNKMTYVILLLHFVGFTFWSLFLTGPYSLAFIFTIVILIQLLIFLFHIFIKNE